MGQHKLKGGDRASNREPLTPTMVQKLVTAAADISKGKRLKVLAGRVSKSDLLSAKEPLSRLTLLQMAVVMNNIPAVEFLFSLGADKKAIWDSLDGTEDGWDLSYMPERAFTDFQNYCNNIGSPNVAMDAFEHSGLSLLHIAALVGHKEMVRFLVEGGHLPVDVRAAVTDATPLMTAITRVCVTEAGAPGPVTHVCGCPTHPDACEVTCQPMLPMVQLLLELGADPSLIDSSGACLLATAAEAGRYGMWRDLITHLPDVVDRCPTHAGRVLYGAAANCVRTGKSEVFDGVLEFIEQRYSTSGRRELFREEVSVPIKRRRAEVAGKFLKIMPGGQFMQTHALSRLCVGANDARFYAMQRLTISGAPFGALRLGQDHYMVNGGKMFLTVNVRMLHTLRLCPIDIAAHADVLCGLLMDTLLHQTAASDPDLSGHSWIVTLLMLLKAYEVDFRSYHNSWPQRFSPELHERFHFCALGKPVSPLVLAAAGAAPGMLRKLLLALWEVYVDDKPGKKLLGFINTPDPCGRVPLIEAVVRKRLDEIECLLEFGADVGQTDARGRSVLHEFVRLGDDSSGQLQSVFYTIVFNYLEASRFSDIPNRTAPDIAEESEAEPEMRTLGEMIARYGAWQMLPALVGAGLDLHENPIHERMGNVLRALVSFDTKDYAEREQDDFLPFLSGPSLPLALRARDTIGVTALGMCMLRGYVGWIKPLVDACRRSDVDIDEVLGWDRPDPFFKLPAVPLGMMKSDSVLPELVKAGYKSENFKSYHARLDQTLCMPEHARIGEELCKAAGEPSMPCLNFNLVMWATLYAKQASIKALIEAGADVNAEVDGTNPCSNAVTIAIENSLRALAVLPTPALPTGFSAHTSSGNQLECLLVLLRAKAAITAEQLIQVLQLVYKAQHLKVAQELWRFLSRKAAVCAGCGLIGGWRTCGHCRTAFYCSPNCQTTHWPKHRSSCQLQANESHAEAGKAAAQDCVHESCA